MVRVGGKKKKKNGRVAKTDKDPMSLIEQMISGLPVTLRIKPGEPIVPPEFVKKFDKQHQNARYDSPMVSMQRVRLGQLKRLDRARLRDSWEGDHTLPEHFAYMEDLKIKVADEDLERMRRAGKVIRFHRIPPALISRRAESPVALTFEQMVKRLIEQNPDQTRFSIHLGGH